MIAARIARRLVRKIVKPAALLLVEAQLRSSEARVKRLTNPPLILVPVQRRARQRQIELIGRRNLVRGW